MRRKSDNPMLQAERQRIYERSLHMLVGDPWDEDAAAGIAFWVATGLTLEMTSQHRVLAWLVHDRETLDPGMPPGPVFPGPGGGLPTAEDRLIDELTTPDMVAQRRQVYDSGLHRASYDDAELEGLAWWVVTARTDRMSTRHRAHAWRYYADITLETAAAKRGITLTPIDAPPVRHI